MKKVFTILSVIVVLIILSMMTIFAQVQGIQNYNISRSIGGIVVLVLAIVAIGKSLKNRSESGEETRTDLGECRFLHF